MENTKVLEECSRICYSCALACERCANECLKEVDVIMMVNCIRLDRICSVICTTTAQVLIMESPYGKTLSQVCAEVCIACAVECERYAELMMHCSACAEECRKCAEACLDVEKHLQHYN